MFTPEEGTFSNVPSFLVGKAFCDNTVISQNYGTFFKQRINQHGWRSSYDQYSLVPYMLRTNGKPGFITYDDSFSTFYRVAYSVWSLDADYDGQSQDLLDAMHNASLPQTK